MGVDQPGEGGLERAPLYVAYRTARQNLTALLDDSPDLAGVPVPSCPEWTVRDLLAHVTGNCASVLGKEPAPSGATLAELLAWWAQAGPRMEHQVATTGRDIQRLVMDTFTHELDVREALEVKPPAEDHPAYGPAFEVVTRGLSWSLTARALPALRLVSDGTTWVVGPGQPMATVTASHHSLYRSLSGRRTPAQIAELDWSEDPARWLPAFYWGPFSQPGEGPQDRS